MSDRHGPREQGRQETRPQDEAERKQTRPMAVETWIFIAGVPFYLIVGLIYGVASGWHVEGLFNGWEAVGTTCLVLLAGLSGLAGGYLWLTARRVDQRPEDDPLGEIHERAGEYGEFAPRSWWPLVLGIAVTASFAGLAIGWWMVGIGVVLGLIGVTGQLFESHRGQHAH